MKLLEVQVRQEDVETVTSLADRHGVLTPSHHPVTRMEEGQRVQVVLNVPNQRVGGLVAAIQEAVGDASFVLPAGENLPLTAPISDLRDRVTDVSPRSALELVLDVEQSIGSWRSLLLYGIVSGLVAAYGVLFNLWFLLTAAMLIAPVGAPVMVAVVGVTMGDGKILRRGLLRFVVALAVMTAAAAGLGLAYGMDGATALMETLTSLSVMSVVLGVGGGAAGAQALVQSDRDSLVTATATGFLVAVSLSPPAAVLGLAIPLGRWRYVALMAFLIALTLAGILLGGWGALRLAGIRPDQPTAGRGSRALSRVFLIAASAVLAGLVALQVALGPSWQKADQARDAETIVKEAVDALPEVRLAEVRARFTPLRDRSTGRETLLVSLVAEGQSASSTAEAALRRHVQDALRRRWPDLPLLVDVSVVPAAGR